MYKWDCQFVKTVIINNLQMTIYPSSTTPPAVRNRPGVIPEWNEEKVRLKLAGDEKPQIDEISAMESSGLLMSRYSASLSL